MIVWLLFVALAWVGHAAWLVRLLNTLYALALNKSFLKRWRLLTGLLILLYPIMAWWWWVGNHPVVTAYLILCLGLAIFTKVVTFLRAIRPKPNSIVSSTSTIHKLTKAIGDGKNRWMAAAPLNQAFDVDFTELKLKLNWLPKELDGLTILMLSDLHFHGTPGRAWFDELFELMKQQPKPDIIALVGDFVDSDNHHTWLAPLLGQLQWNEVGLALLGNHDKYHQPEQIRTELKQLGYTMLSNCWQRVIVRGVPITVFGDERPWFVGNPISARSDYGNPTSLKSEDSGSLDITPISARSDYGNPTSLKSEDVGSPTSPKSEEFDKAPMAGFRLYLTHSPDNFPTAHDAMCDLVLAGHVHGGGIRLPLLGSIFVPSVFGRAYDCGVFEWDRTVMVVGRGISGKEPIRWNCRPQVLRLTLEPV